MAARRPFFAATLVLAFAGCTTGTDKEGDSESPCVGFDCPDPDDTDDTVDTLETDPVDSEETDETDDTDLLDSDTSDTVVMHTDTGDSGETDTDTDTETDTETDTDTDTDTDADTDTDTDTDTEPPGPTSVTDMSRGDLVITELMIRPDACPDSQAEYVEIKNLSAEVVDLDGLELGDGSQSYTISTSVLVQPDAYVVGVRSSTTRCDYGFTADFEYSNVTLEDSGGLFEISSGAVTFDTVDFDAFALVGGHALHLQAGSETETDNDAAAAWCDAITLLGSTTDYGSPGIQADGCYTDSGGAGPTGDTFLPVETDTVDPPDTEVDTVPHTGDSAAPLEIITGTDLREGDLIISEVMIDSSDCLAGTRHHYVEVFNNTDKIIQPAGMSIKVGTGSIPGAIPINLVDVTSNPDIMPGEFSLLVRAQFGGFCWDSLTPHFDYTTLTLAPDRIRIENSAGPIDTVDMTGWAVTRGVSWSFDPLLMETLPIDPTANDGQSAWCLSTSLLTTEGGFSDLGTPFEANYCIIDTGPFDTGPTNDTAPGVIGKKEMSEHDVVITEIMIDSQESGCAANTDIYLEVLNTTEFPINLEDLQLDVGSLLNKAFDYSGPNTGLSRSWVMPGEYAVVERKHFATRCFSYTEQFRASGISFGFAEYTLHTPQGVVVDSVDMRTWALPLGGSISLNPDQIAIDPTQNDDPLNWCNSTTLIDGAQTALGTPGFANDCVNGPGGPDTDTDTDLDTEVDTDVVVDTELPTDTDIPGETRTWEDLADGDLVITEVMTPPTEPGCSAAMAAYLEIYNASEFNVFLDDMPLENNGTTRNLELVSGQPALVLSGARTIVIRKQFSGFCYGDTVEAQFRVSSLATPTGVMRLIGNGGDTIDEVDFTGHLFNDGFALNVAPDYADTVSNDDLANWCDAAPRIGATADRGTPYAEGVCWTGVDTDPGDTDTDTDTTGHTDSDTDPGGRGTTIEFDEVEVGELVITEVMFETTDPSCGASTAYYVELYNASTLPVVPDDLVMEIDGVTTSIEVSSGSGQIAPGSYFLVQKKQFAGFCYDASVTPEFRASNLNPAASPIRIYSGAAGDVLVDEVDFSAIPWLAGHSLNLRPETLLDATANDDPAAWCDADSSLTGTPDFGTPGLVGDCFTGDPVDTDLDTDTDTTPDTHTDNPVDDRGPTVEFDEFLEGELVITEVMPASATPGCSDVQSFYMELYNASTERVCPDDLAMEVDGVSTQLELVAGQAACFDPGAYFIVIKKQFAGFCYDADVDGQFRASNFDLGNILIRLLSGAAGDVLVDEVDFTGFVFTPGHALNLSPDAAQHAAANDDAINWCDAGSEIGVEPGFGTPGAIGSCFVPDTGPIVDTLIDTDTDTDTLVLPPEGREDDGVITADELVTGELVFTELMISPLDCSEPNAEYIEVYNTLDWPVDPSGLELSLEGGTARSVSEFFDFMTPNLIARQDYGVLVKRTFGSYCYPSTSFEHEYRYSSLALETGDLRMEGPTGLLIDAVDTTGWTVDAGVALQFDDRSVEPDAVANNAEFSWCNAEPLILGASTDRGTPGAPADCAIELIDTAPPADEADYVITDVGPGDLVITEINENPVDCPDADGEFIEIYNAKNGSINLNGLQLSINATTAVLDFDLVIPQGAYRLFSRTQTTFCYQVLVDFDWGNASLSSSGAVISLIGVNALGTPVPIDTVDTTTASGFDVHPAGASAQLDLQFHTAAANDLLNNWCVSEFPADATSGRTDLASPRSTNDICVEAFDTGCAADSSCVFDTSDSEFGDTDTYRVDGVDIATLGSGDLLITEFMANPTDCSPDTTAEYIEVYNNTADLVDLRGVFVEDAARSYQWRFQTLVAAGGYAVGVNTQNGVSNRCYDFDYDFQYQRVTLDDNGDVLRLVSEAGVVFDEVDYTDFPTISGAAWELDPAFMSAVGNDDPSAWCVASDLIPGGNNDLGSPGVVNDCTEVSETDTEVLAASGIDAVLPGELVITEVMVDVNEPGCSDLNGEYFELYNGSADVVNLEGMLIESTDGQFLVTEDVLIDPGAWAVGVRDANPRCYAFTPDFVYSTIRFRGADLLRLSNAAGAIDEVDFRSWADVPTGASLMLSGDVLDAVNNDDPLLWCGAPDLILGADIDRGNPGVANPTCELFDTDGLDDTGEPPVDTEVEPGDRLDDGVIEAAELLAGELLFSEIMIDPQEPGCATKTGQFIEVVNVTAWPVAPGGLVMEIAGDLTVLEFFGSGDGLIGPSEFAVLVPKQFGGFCYDFTPEFRFAGVDVQAGFMELSNDLGRVDAVGMETWTFPAGRSLAFDPDADYTGASNNAQSNWCPSAGLMPGATTDLGSPGTENLCGLPGDSDTDPLILDSDTDLVGGGPWDDTYVPTGSGTPVDSLAVGDLVVSEFLVNPRDCSDNRAEFIEVHNTTAGEVSLTGLTLETSGGSFTIAAAVAVAPHGFAVGVLSNGVQPRCYVVDQFADFTYTDAVLSNFNGFVRLSNASLTLDEVVYDDFVPISGPSWSLDPEYLDAVSNDDPALWCPASEADVLFDGTFDRGTPGWANPSCNLVVDTDPDFVDTSDTSVLDTGPTPAPIADAEVGDLIITELMVEPRDCDATDAQYIEIKNNSQQRFDLDGLIIGTGQVQFTLQRDVQDLFIEPGETLVGRRSSTTPCYDFRQDFEFNAVVFSVADGLAFIANETTVIDLLHIDALDLRDGRAWTLDPERYGVPGAGGPGEPPSAATFFGTYTNDDPAYWCEGWNRVQEGLSDKGSPGVDNAACVSVGELPPYPAGYIMNVDELEGGELVITEIMSSPDACFDFWTEYVELHSVASFAVDLEGLAFGAGGSTGVVATSLVVQPGDTVFGRRSNYRDDCYPGLTPDFVYGGVSLPDDEGVLTISNSHSDIDEVDYTGFDTIDGSSMILLAGFETATDNDLAEYWCTAASPFAGSDGDLGSPGSVNGGCPVIIDTDTGVTPAGPLDIDDVPAGGLVITEFLAHNQECPASVGGAEERYIEIYNALGEEVQLDGLRIGTLDHEVAMDVDLVIEPGAYKVLATDVRALNQCMGLTPDARLPLVITLEPAGAIYLANSAGSVIDSLSLSDWPQLYSRSYQLHPESLGAALNDDVLNWCLSENLLPGATSTFGTPGAANDCSVHSDFEYDTGVFDSATDTLVDTDFVGPIAAYGVLAWGTATAFEGVIYQGNWTWLSGLNDYVTGIEANDCVWTWNAAATAAVDVSQSCPDCDFAFEIARTGGMDLRLAEDGVASDCTDPNLQLHGGPARATMTPIIVAFSSVYSTMFYESAGVLTPYTYNATLSGTDFEWQRMTTLTYYY